VIPVFTLRIKFNCHVFTKLLWIRITVNQAYIILHCYLAKDNEAYIRYSKYFQYTVDFSLTL